ncbi:hypothetical protein GCM10017744_038870 [Streptomyces antimycoticus]|uniref:Uncharacterized protein n=1 Tax=Streptomyces antimycoticus TaxID=68175 RepID=A0A4D4KH88_9ACTN|nr:hypothetical protein SANT12839_063710 [Streptomyces antimycoticus]
MPQRETATRGGVRFGAGDREHVPGQGVVFAAAERLGLQPLDRADEVHPAGYRFAVGADQVDLGVVLAVPPGADRLRMGPPVIGEQAAAATRG